MSPSSADPTAPSKPRWWRSVRIWPRSLAGQLVAALFIALIISQAITIILFAVERYDLARKTIRVQVIERTASLVRLLNDTDQSLHARILRTADGPGIRFKLYNKTRLALPARGTADARIARSFEKSADLPPNSVRLRVMQHGIMGPYGTYRPDEDGYEAPPWKRGSKDVSKDWRPSSDWDRDRKKRRDFDDDDDKNDKRHKHRRPPLRAWDMTVAVPLETGQWLHVRAGEFKKPPKWGVPFLVSMGVMATLIALIVFFTVRKITAPLRSLERAARQLGRGETFEPLPVKGPRELQGTISAFNAMQERLMRFVQDRTRMLAAISHDLRTPITTLRLRAEFIDDDDMREKVLATLEEMQSMTDAVLAFAREDASKEDTKSVDVSALVSSLGEDFCDMGKDVRYLGDDSIVYSCRPVSLKRAVRNLLENAIRYAGSAELRVRDKGDHIEIDVLDNGPGIPADRLDEVFAPFFRVEGSRNKETGGVGLGLSITRTIIRSHGGDVRLVNREDGGLKATIQLPR